MVPEDQRWLPPEWTRVVADVAAIRELSRHNADELKDVRSDIRLLNVRLEETINRREYDADQKHNETRLSKLESSNAWLRGLLVAAATAATGAFVLAILQALHFVRSGP